MRHILSLHYDYDERCVFNYAVLEGLSAFRKNEFSKDTGVKPNIRTILQHHQVALVLKESTGVEFGCHTLLPLEKIRGLLLTENNQFRRNYYTDYISDTRLVEKDRSHLCFSIYYFLYVICTDSKYAKEARESFFVKINDCDINKAKIDKLKKEFDALDASLNQERTNIEKSLSGEDNNIYIKKYLNTIGYYVKSTDSLELILSNRKQSNTKETSHGHLRKVVDVYTDSLTEDCTPHRLLEDVEQFFQDHTQGYLYVAAGPGMGKSVLMGSIMQKYAPQVIPFYFRYHLGQNADNKKQGFLRYLAAHLKDRTGYGIAPSVLEKQEEFQERIFEICADNTSITQKNPLIIVIDSVDEMGHYSEKHSAIEQLGLPGRLPAHVYIIISERIQQWDAVTAQKERYHTAYSAFETVMLVAPGTDNLPDEYAIFAKKQLETVCDHVSRIANAMPYIIAPRKNEWDIEEFVLKAGCNFMLLRCLLHDPDCWQDQKPRDILPKNIEEYYAFHYARMRRRAGEYPFLIQLVHCFAVRTQWTHIMLSSLFNVDDTTHTILREEIAAWQKQGLLISSSKDYGTEWLQTYHRTYTAYLWQKIPYTHQRGFYHPFTPYIRRLLKDNEGVFPDTIRDASSQEQEAWIRLIVKLVFHAGSLDLVKKILLHRGLWEYIDENNLHTETFRQLCIIPITVYEHQSDIERLKSVLREIVDFITNECGFISLNALSSLLHDIDKNVVKHDEISIRDIVAEKIKARGPYIPRNSDDAT